MTRRSWTTLQRARLFEAHGGKCHICGGAIDGTREAWDVEHIIPLALGGDDNEANCAPAHRKCHAAKTATDKGQITKANRVRAKHLGARKRSSFATSRGGKFKQRIGGEIVRR